MTLIPAVFGSVRLRGAGIATGGDRLVSEKLMAAGFDVVAVN